MIWNRKYWVGLFCLFGFILHGVELPPTEEGLPYPGKRVRVYLDSFPKAYYLLYLPPNFTESSKSPLIFESPATNTEIEACCLGYGISQGKDYIWVCAPCIGEDSTILNWEWGKEPLCTVNYWLAILEDLNKQFDIDRNKILLAGFSRGAISTIFIGNYNESISSKWAAYFAHSHFDGCCRRVPGNPEERIFRIHNRPVLITHGEYERGKQCSYNAYQKLLNEGFQVSYIHVPLINHQPHWILSDSEEAQKARDWLKNLFFN